MVLALELILLALVLVVLALIMMLLTLILIVLALKLTNGDHTIPGTDTTSILFHMFWSVPTSKDILVEFTAPRGGLKVPGVSTGGKLKLLKHSVTIS